MGFHIPVRALRDTASSRQVARSSRSNRLRTRNARPRLGLRRVGRQRGPGLYAAPGQVPLPPRATRRPPLVAQISHAEPPRASALAPTRLDGPARRRQPPQSARHPGSPEPPPALDRPTAADGTLADSEVEILTYADTTGLISQNRHALEQASAAGFRKDMIAVVSYPGAGGR